MQRTGIWRLSLEQIKATVADQAAVACWGAGPQAVREQYSAILLKTSSVAGTPRVPTIVAYGLIRPGEAGN